MSTDQNLEKFQQNWSEKLGISFWVSILLNVFALVVIVIVVAVPGTLGVDHKVYILGVVGTGLVCLSILLIKARSDSSSLLVWSKISDIISGFVIGIAVGQLTRHLTTAAA